MSAECKYLNPLHRDGTSQRQRLVKALLPSYIKLDGRHPGELLRYARDYGKLLRFYNPAGEVEGDWAEFFDRDISVAVALIGTEAEEQRDTFQNRRQEAFAAAAQDRAHKFVWLFEPLLDLARKFDGWYQHPGTGAALKAVQERLIRSLLGDAMREAVSFVKRIEDPAVFGAVDPDMQRFFDNWDMTTAGFADIWALREAEADSTVLPHGVAGPESEFADAVGRVSAVFDRFQEALGTLVKETPLLFKETIQKYPQHQPHLALFLTFLRLFRHAQKDLNAVTSKHLDFYYQDVLRLQPAPAQPDKVHVLFQLQKNLAPQLVPKGTLLLAGKDARKVNVFYGTDAELVVNHAEIDPAVGLKTLFAEKVSRGQDTMAASLFAAEKADSADGRGAPLQDADGKWLTFGADTMPDARVGFAIASPMFLLSEGARTIRLDFQVNTAQDFLAGESPATVRSELKRNLRAQASGAKAWIDLETRTVDFLPAAGPVSTVSFTLTAPAGAAAIVGFDSKILKEPFDTTLPVIRFICNNQGLSAKFMDLWRQEDITDYSENQLYPRLSFVRYKGKLYRAKVDIKQVKCPPKEKESEVDQYWDLYHEKDVPEYSDATPFYRRHAFVSEQGKVYRANQDIQGPGKAPSRFPDKWERYDESHIQDYSDSVPYYAHLAMVRYQGNVYRAKLGIGDPGYRPGNYPEFWQQIERSNPYKYLQRMEVKDVTLTVQVGDFESGEAAGMRSLVLENDFGVLDPAKPFLPFGPIPRTEGSFLVGSYEVFQKPLTRLKLRVQWAGAPDKFADHYKDYPDQSEITGNDYFTADFKIQNQGTWDEFGTGVALFVSPDARVARDFDFTSVGLTADPGLRPFARFDSTVRQGFLKATLKQDFLHAEYPRALARAAKIPEQNPLPPYTPLIASLDLAYEASESLGYEHRGPRDYGDRVERIFQLGPFGHREIYPISDDSAATGVPICRKLVPEFTVTAKQADGSLRAVDAEGTLFLGLAGLQPPQNLSMLFQIAEGSEDPEISEPPQVVWSHLDADRWVDFQAAQVVSDSTEGLLTSGVIQFAMPDTMTNANASMPAPLHWIKASVADRSAGLPKIIAIHTQAAVASFRDQGNDPAHLAAPLPGDTIAKLKERKAAIRSVTQPYASFGGRMAEPSKAFRIRTSERLRHKQRAVTIFDYERLVLREFPEVYKVKCINHTGAGSECAAGYVRVVVIPNLRNRNAVDPLRPRFSRNKLQRIEEFLTGLASDFVTLRVTNPDYEEVKARFNVRFKPGKDKGFYTSKLNQDIIRFLSPWRYEEGADLALGGRVHRSAILNWIEETDYVDFVTDFQLDQIVGTTVHANVEEARASHSGAAIVSAKQHEIGDDIVCCEDKPAKPVEPPSPGAAAQPRAVVVPSEFERYLGNIREAEVHDLMNLKPECQLEEIPSAWRTYFDRLQTALGQGYDYCAYCFTRELSQR